VFRQVQVQVVVKVLGLTTVLAVADPLQVQVVVKVLGLTTVLAVAAERMLVLMVAASKDRTLMDQQDTAETLVLIMVAMTVLMLLEASVQMSETLV
jgi:hypothetical protein